MTEQEALKHFDFHQEVNYDQDSVKAYFDIEFEDNQPYITAESQVYYNSTNITKLVDLVKVDSAIDWKKVKKLIEFYY